MKKQILSFLFVLSAALLISTSAFAGGNQAPSPGQTVTYSVTSGLASYQWKVLTSADLEVVSGTEFEWVASQGTSPTQDIKWLASSAGKTYKIWVQGKDGNGCWTDPKTWNVTVTSTEICIATAANQGGSVTTAAPNNSDKCSFLVGGTTGSSGSGYLDPTDFYVTITGGIPNLSLGSAYNVTYSVSDGTTTVPVVTTTSDLITNATGVGAVKLTINPALYVNFFTNTGTDSKPITITLIKATYAGVDVTNTCTGKSFPISVKPLPVIAF